MCSADSGIICGASETDYRRSGSRRSQVNKIGFEKRAKDALFFGFTKGPMILKKREAKEDEAGAYLVGRKKKEYNNIVKNDFGI